MKRVLLICAAAAAMLWLGGCSVVAYEHHRHPGPPHVIGPPPYEVVEVIEVPPPHPRWPRHHWHPRPWR